MLVSVIFWSERLASESTSQDSCVNRLCFRCLTNPVRMMFRMSTIPGLQIENVVRSADPDFESQGLRS